MSSSLNPLKIAHTLSRGKKNTSCTQIDLTNCRHRVDAGPSHVVDSYSDWSSTSIPRLLFPRSPAWPNWLNATRRETRESTRAHLGRVRASNLDVPIADTTAREQPMGSRDLSRIGGAWESSRTRETRGIPPHRTRVTPWGLTDVFHLSRSIDRLVDTLCGSDELKHVGETERGKRTCSHD